MQKIINVLAVASAVVSLAVVGSAGYVYVRKDAIIESIKEKALGSVMGGLGAGSGALNGAVDLPLGDLANPQAAPDALDAPAAPPVQF
tara:strand:- start:213 stop:476 length:264 start_codon:yes stop_codon:yes gene_type:complete